MSAKLKDGFKDMLTVCQVRGKDSTGIFTVNGEVYDVAKMVGSPEFLMDMKSFDSALSGLPRIIAGHCRRKTVGENIPANAHPYDFENLVGMHNGTLRNYYTWPGFSHKRTDSYALFDRINDIGVEETFEDVDPAGAWALVWYDKANDTLNFLRNDDRPLWMTWTEDKRNILWASEPWFFGAVERWQPLWDGKDNNDELVSKYWQLPPNQWWSFSVNDRAKKDERTLLLHPIREIKAKKTATVYAGAAAWHLGRPKEPNKSDQKGGEVVRPFADSLDDDISDLAKSISRLPKLPAPKETTEKEVQGASRTTNTSLKRLDSSLLNVSDFRPASMRGVNSSRPTLSLLQSSLKGFLPKGNEENLRESAKLPDLRKRLVSLRKPFFNSDWYISCKKTNSEWNEKEFETNTKGICFTCKTPIGGLEEVHEFVSPTRFICSTCVGVPTIEELVKIVNK
jgi:hypothetical protein